MNLVVFIDYLSSLIRQGQQLMVTTNSRFVGVGRNNRRWQNRQCRVRILTSMQEDTKIVVNGQEYSGVEQMPPKIREEYLRAVAVMRGRGR